MSSERAESNRRNSQSSTGPADTTATRFNAVKHGLTAADVTPFDAGLYEPMLEQFRLELQPETQIEDVMVQRIALYATRLQRAASLSADFMREAMSPPTDDMDCAPSTLDALSIVATGKRSVRSLRLSDLKAAVAALPDAMRSFAEGGDTSANTNEMVAAMDRFSSAVEALPDRRARGGPDVLGIVQTLETKFQRYETQLENRLLRLLNEYERIKRLRSGEAVPAPINVNVTVDTEGAHD